MRQKGVYPWVGVCRCWLKLGGLSLSLSRSPLISLSPSLPPSLLTSLSLSKFPPSSHLSLLGPLYLSLSIENPLSLS